MEITGRHVFAVTAGAFAVIIGVNLVMAWQAVATFPGLEVKNSYVASQTFDADRAAQEALGWTVAPRMEGGDLVLAVTEDATGRPAEVATIEAIVGRSTTAAQDVTPAFAFDGAAFRAPVDLASGYWTILLTATAPDGTRFRQRLPLHVD